MSKPTIRYQYKSDEDPLYDRVLVQEKRWWGWKTVYWKYVHPTEDIISDMETQVAVLEQRLGS